MNVAALFGEVWYGSHWLRYPLMVFVPFYRAAVVLRRLWYRLKKPARISVPVVVVGSLTAGGGGKTPVVIALVQWFRQRGYAAGVVSRGYRGARLSSPQPVTADSDPAIVGDEPVLTAQRTQEPVVVHVDRHAAARYLVENCGVDLVITDDGLQHYGLARDVEVAVIDGVRRFGNGLLLPAGPMREPETRLAEADFVLVRAPAQPHECEILLKPVKFTNVRTRESVPANHFEGSEVHACAGISRPQAFFDTLKALGITVRPHPFPDHHAFCPSDFHSMLHLPIVITEKDAVKCRPLVHRNEWKNMWALQVDAVLEEQFLSALMEKLKRTLPQHGS